MTVVGVLKDKSLVKTEFQGIALKGEQNNIYVPLQTALKVFRFGPYESDIDEFRVQLKKEVPAGTAAATLAHLMKRRHKEIGDYEMIVPEALLEQHRKTQNIFTIVMACIARISLLVGRDRDHEHHAGHGARADQGDRAAPGRRGQADRHPQSVHRRDGFHFRDRRRRGDLIRVRLILGHLGDHRLARRLDDYGPFCCHCSSAPSSDWPPDLSGDEGVEAGSDRRAPWHD